MQNRNCFVYVKYLYNNATELSMLKKELFKYGIVVKIASKKDLFTLGIEQYLNTYLFFYPENIEVNKLKEVLNILKKFEALQVLGIVNKKNLFLTEENLENNNIILGVCKYLFLAPTKSVMLLNKIIIKNNI
jgi:hypothetical protein